MFCSKQGKMCLISNTYLLAKKKAKTTEPLFQELTKREVVNVTHLVIPAELGALLHTAAGGEMFIFHIKCSSDEGLTYNSCTESLDRTLCSFLEVHAQAGQG